MGTSETITVTNTKLNRIAWLSKQDSKKKFDCLMHLFNSESLIDCFQELDKNKAVGIDGVNKMAYAANLYGNIEEMVKPACKGTVALFRYADDGAPRRNALSISGFIEDEGRPLEADLQGLVSNHLETNDPQWDLREAYKEKAA